MTYESIVKLELVVGVMVSLAVIGDTDGETMTACPADLDEPVVFSAHVRSSVRMATAWCCVG